MSNFHTKASKVTETINVPTEVILVHLTLDEPAACILRRILDHVTGMGPVKDTALCLHGMLSGLDLEAYQLSAGTIVDFMRVR